MMSNFCDDPHLDEFLENAEVLLRRIATHAYRGQVEAAEDLFRQVLALPRLRPGLVITGETAIMELVPNRLDYRLAMALERVDVLYVHQLLACQERTLAAVPGVGKQALQRLAHLQQSLCRVMQ